MDIVRARLLGSLTSISISLDLVRQRLRTSILLLPPARRYLNPVVSSLYPKLSARHILSRIVSDIALYR